MARNKNTPQKPSLIARSRAWIRRHPRKALILGGLGVILIAGGTAYALLSQPAPKIALPAFTPKPKPKIYYSPLTGVKVKDKAATEQAVTAIMIENSPEARPQSGLKQSGVVYEAIAEGGITRFLVLYQQEKPSLVGPVRSLRQYYLDWATPYNATIAHVGGSAAALKNVRNGSYRDLDQFFNPNTFWRSTDRYAPHNVYTSFQKIGALNKAKKYTTSKFTGFERIDGKPVAKPNATNVTINFGSSLFNTNYRYDKKSNSYLRSVGSAAHNDREKGRIAPNVVVAMNVDMVNVMEDGYRESIKTSGEGKATIFQNGTARTVTWHKKNQKSPLQFLDKNRKPVALVRGQTWIAAVPNNTGSVSWK